MYVVGEAGGKLLVFVSLHQPISAPAAYLLVCCTIWACVPISEYSSGYIDIVMPTLAVEALEKLISSKEPVGTKCRVLAALATLYLVGDMPVDRVLDWVCVVVKVYVTRRLIRKITGLVSKLEGGEQLGA